MTELLKTTGTLVVGVVFNGETHREFTLRLPTVGDEIDVSESGVPDAGFGVALMATCLDTLGTVPKEAITYDLLRDMDSDDYRQLTAARDALKKKRADANGGSGTSGLLVSDSDGTDTANQTSGLSTL